MTQTISRHANRLDSTSTHSGEELTHFEPQIQAHPLGVRPSGNALTGSSAHARDSIGTFGALPDEVILTDLQGLLCLYFK
jgi:hypothetical protein